MKLETIYKKTKTGATQEWTIEVSDNKYRTHSGQVGGKIKKQINMKLEIYF
jgi:hypothetical protein